MQEIQLKNGSTEPTPIVATTIIALESLIAEKPIAFYELVCLARDREHKLFSGTGADLVARGLVDGNLERGFYIHSSIRNVIESAVVGEGLAMVLGDPVLRTAHNP